MLSDLSDSFTFAVKEKFIFQKSNCLLRGTSYGYFRLCGIPARLTLGYLIKESKDSRGALYKSTFIKLTVAKGTEYALYLTG